MQDDCSLYRVFLLFVAAPALPHTAGWNLHEATIHIVAANQPRSIMELYLTDLVSLAFPSRRRVYNFFFLLSRSLHFFCSWPSSWSLSMNRIAIGTRLCFSLAYNSTFWLRFFDGAISHCVLQLLTGYKNSTSLCIPRTPRAKHLADPSLAGRRRWQQEQSEREAVAGRETLPLHLPASSRPGKKQKKLPLWIGSNAPTFRN